MLRLFRPLLPLAILLNVRAGCTATDVPQTLTQKVAGLEHDEDNATW
jgi:hypothetical protein